MSRPLWRLRFAGVLETRFRAERAHNNLPLVRLTITVCLVVHLATIALDWFLLERQLMNPWPALGMFGIALPACVAYTLLAFLPNTNGMLRRIAPYLVAANGPGVSLMLLAPASPALPDNLIVLNPIFGLLLSGMLLRQALPAALLVTGFHLALKGLVGAGAAALAGDALLLYGSLALCAFGAWQLERLERSAWMQERALREAAVRDPLTGLGNRNQLFDQGPARLRHVHRAEQSLAVLMIDVDHFKEYNDSHGHAAGDDCLRRVAAEIGRAARRPLDLSVRYGGEEFVVLLASDLPGARERAESLRASVQGLDIPHPASPAGVVTVSVGIADSRDHPQATLDGLIAAADKALYAAKRFGRNQVRIEESAPANRDRNGTSG